MDDGLLPQFGGLSRLIGFFMVMEAFLLKEAAARAEAQGRFVYSPSRMISSVRRSPALESQLSFWQGIKTSAFLPSLAALLKGMTLHDKENRERHRGFMTSRKTKKPYQPVRLRSFRLSIKQLS